MPAVSQSQQRLMGMVHAYQKGKLKHAPKKIREVAKHISEEDAEHFAKTKHDGLPSKKEKEEKKAAAGQSVTVTIGKKSFTFPSKKAAVIYLSALPSISPSEAQQAISSESGGVGAVRLSYPGK